jgi:hypothetical protein
MWTYSRRWLLIDVNLWSLRQLYMLLGAVYLAGLLCCEWWQPGLLRQWGAPALDWWHPERWLSQLWGGE